MTLATLRTLLARELAELERIVALCADRLTKREDFRQAGTEDILADSVASCLYTHALQPDRVFELCMRLGAVWRHVRADLKAFIGTLGELDGDPRP